MKARNIFFTTIIIFSLWMLTQPLMSQTSENNKKVILHKPEIKKDSDMCAGKNVTWDCIWLGSYPQTEIVDRPKSSGIMKQARKDPSHVTVDESLYKTLQTSKEWNDREELTLDGVRYKRMKKPNDQKDRSEEFYQWKDGLEYHYFRFDKIKWRILNIADGKMFLLADRILDSHPEKASDEEEENNEDEEDNDSYSNEPYSNQTPWAKSSIRDWLNGYNDQLNQEDGKSVEDSFIDTAFSSSIRDDYLLENSIGDKVSLLSEKDLLAEGQSDAGAFSNNGQIYDEARRAEISTYACAAGVTSEEVPPFPIKGNWLILSETEDYIYDEDTGEDKTIDVPVLDGYLVDYKGTIDSSYWEHFYDYNGIRPTIIIPCPDDSQMDIQYYAGKVSSSDMKWISDSEKTDDGHGAVNLDTGILYKGLDFNNDGKKDNFRITPYTGEEDGYCVFTLNGKSKRVFIARGYKCTYYKYDDNNEYLLVYMHQFGGGTLNAYRYDGDKLKEVYEFNTGLATNIFSSAKDDTVWLESSFYHARDSIKQFGMDQSSKDPEYLFAFRLDPNKHSFYLESNYADIKEPIEVTYTGKTFHTSSSPEDPDQKGLTLEKGMKCKITGFYHGERKGKKGTIVDDDYYKVDHDGVEGWIECGERFE